MPGAYLKGNSFFPGSRFIVDEISRAWNLQGIAESTIINHTEFTTSSYCTVQYYKLKNIISLHVEAVLKPSSFPYTGIENDTSYIYTGDFVFSRVNTTATVRLPSLLTSAPYHFERSVNIEDFKTGVFFETNISSVLGMIHLNGIMDSTMLVITVPSGMLPNHEYKVCGTLIYECL